MSPPWNFMSHHWSAIQIQVSIGASGFSALEHSPRQRSGVAWCLCNPGSRPAQALWNRWSRRAFLQHLIEHRWHCLTLTLTLTLTFTLQTQWLDQQHDWSICHWAVDSQWQKQIEKGMNISVSDTMTKKANKSVTIWLAWKTSCVQWHRGLWPVLSGILQNQLRSMSMASRQGDYNWWSIWLLSPKRP